MSPIIKDKWSKAFSSLFRLLSHDKLHFKTPKPNFPYLLILLIILLPACRKFVRIETPSNAISQGNVYENDLTATTVLTGVYISLAVGTTADLCKFGGLLADEWLLYTDANVAHTAYFTNSLEAGQGTNNSGTQIWNSFYPLVYTCNAAIEGLNSSKSLSSYVKTQLLGEAHFMRAWLYFHLVNIYGEIPLPVSSNPEENRLLPRASVQKVYELITDDLLTAQELLNSEFVNLQLQPYNGSTERVRPTKWAATAMLARVYLYLGQYSGAETEASQIIANANLFSLLPLNDVFLKNSAEAIWQLQPTVGGLNTQEGSMFHLAADPVGLGVNKPVHLSNLLFDSFTLGDQRREQWIDSLIIGGTTYHFPVKYKMGAYDPAVTTPDAMSEYSMVLRLAEQYLIRAEARAMLGDLAGSIADIDLIRDRAGLPLIANVNPDISQEALLELILHERQVELFSELGHRWFDLKRTGKINDVMSIVTPQKNGSWETTDQWLPIPYNELLLNPNLTQNEGY